MPAKRRPYIESFGTVPLVDDSTMTVKLVLDFETEKILAAMPMPSRKTDETGMSREEKWRRLLTPVVGGKR